MCVCVCVCVEGVTSYSKYGIDLLLDYTSPSIASFFRLAIQVVKFSILYINSASFKIKNIHKSIPFLLFIYRHAFLCFFFFFNDSPVI